MFPIVRNVMFILVGVCRIFFVVERSNASAMRNKQNTHTSVRAVKTENRDTHFVANELCLVTLLLL